MGERHEGLEIVGLRDVDELRDWLTRIGTGHPGVWVRLRRAASSAPSLAFGDLLVEGIAQDLDSRGRLTTEGRRALGL